jgi:PEP-CTERM motif
MSATPGNIGGQTFTLQITFSAPQGLAPSNQITLVYSITPFNMVGGVFFEPNPFNGQFTFSDANCESDPTSVVPGQQTTCGTGSFLVFFLDRDLSPNQTLPIGANIAAAQQEIPEPTTLLLLGTGVVAVVLKKRRPGIKTGVTVLQGRFDNPEQLV